MSNDEIKRLKAENDRLWDWRRGNSPDELECRAGFGIAGMGRIEVTERAVIHELKTWPEYYDAVESGVKRFEVRKNDRNYRVGDRLVLKRWEPSGHYYTGQQMERTVTYVMHGGQFGLEAGYCVMGVDG